MESVKLLTEFSIVKFLSLVNEVFSDYPVPVNWDTFSFNLDARENSISMENSFIFLKDDEPAGFIVCCVRKDKGRIDSMGVIKSERGSGLAYRMLEHALEALRWKKVRTVTLEVLESELRAVRFYEKNGFRISRKLFTMIKEIQHPTTNVNFLKVDPRWIHQASVEAMISLQRNPNWQREPATLLLAGNRYKTARTTLMRTVGYVVWGSTEKSVFIVDCAPLKQPEIYDHLLNEAVNFVCATEGKNICTIANVPENDPMFSAATNNEFKKVLTQLEMTLHLY